MKYILTDEQRYKLIQLLLEDLQTTNKGQLHINHATKKDQRSPRSKGIR